MKEQGQEQKKSDEGQRRRLTAQSTATTVHGSHEPLDGPVLLAQFCLGRGNCDVACPRPALDEGHQNGCTTWFAQSREAGRITLPQATERGTQTVERELDPAQVLASAMTEGA